MIDSENILIGEITAEGELTPTIETVYHFELGINSGADGKSAYQTWLDLGNEGTEEDFINSLKSDGINYIHDQIASAKEWRITHNMGKYPSVVIVDSGGNVVVGSVQYLSVDEVLVSFTCEFSGKAYLN